MKGLVFGIALASVGVAALGGVAVAREIIGHGAHGGHGGAGPGWITGVPTACVNVAPGCGPTPSPSTSSPS